LRAGQRTIKPVFRDTDVHIDVDRDRCLPCIETAARGRRDGV